MSSSSPKTRDMPLVVSITNSSLRRAIRALNQSQGRLRFSLYSGRVIHGASIGLPTLLEALYRLTATNKTLQAFVGVANPNQDSTGDGSEISPYISMDEDHCLTAEITVVDSAEAALKWTAVKYEEFESIGPQSNARFLIAYIQGQGIMLSIAASHVLLDGHSLQLFWEMLDEEIYRPHPAQTPNISEDTQLVFRTVSIDWSSPDKKDLLLKQSDQKYWEWIAKRIQQKPLDGHTVPFQRSCRAYEFGEESKFLKEYSSSSNRDYTHYENFVAFFARLVFENTNVDSVQIQCPVALRSDGAKNSLGYHIDSRPIFIDRDDAQGGEVQALIRSCLKRLLGLPVPWRDYLVMKSGISREAIHGTTGILVSKFFDRDHRQLHLGTHRTTPISEYDLRKELKTRYTIKPGRRALTDMAPNFSYQVLPGFIRVLSNINFMRIYE
jgi:hypothetical protein